MSRQRTNNRVVTVRGDVVPATPAVRAALPRARYHLTLVLGVGNEMHVRAASVALPGRVAPALPRALDDGDVIVTHDDDGHLLGIEFLAAKPLHGFPELRRHIATSPERGVLRAAHATAVAVWTIAESAIGIIAASSPDTFARWNAKRAASFGKKLAYMFGVAERIAQAGFQAAAEEAPVRWRTAPAGV